MKKVKYDFLHWTSFPSSISLVNDEGLETFTPALYGEVILNVHPGATVKTEIHSKLQDVIQWSHAPLEGSADGIKWRRLNNQVLAVPRGTRDWMLDSWKTVIPADVKVIFVYLAGSTGTKEAPGITWFDDLKIYQDDVLIYSNDFSNWSPVIGAGVGAPIGGIAGYLLGEPLGPMVSEAVGAGLGGGLGAAVGLLTVAGVIPIPALGATLEEPEAPTQLGKYRITG